MRSPGVIEPGGKKRRRSGPRWPLRGVRAAALRASTRSALAATIAASAALPLAAQPPEWERWESVSFMTADGVTVYGDLYESPFGGAGPLILLFHQGAADGRGEYGPIVGRLTDQGFSILRIDQRRGGERFGGPNRTVAELDGAEFGYCDAYPDLKAALDFVRARGFVGPLVAWGGSYSAALTIRLAAEHGDELAAALAFSPASGEPLRGCRPEQFADAIEIPVLVLRPDREMEIEWVSGQMLKLGRAGLETFVAASEGHGSSILVTERAGADPILTWETVLRFLRVATAPDVRPREVELQSADGLRVTADLYETASRNDPVILLFHQSGSSRGEYRRIAPKLVAMGYNALAVDLRWGARDRWNLFRNETAARYGTTEIMAEARSGMRDRVWPTVFAAYEDMLASLDWLGANGFAGPRIVLGSSFSAILVLKMAAEREVAAVLAYSPGEYHDTDTTMVAGWANEVDAPAYVAAGIDEGERVAPVFAALPGPDKLLFQAERGAHGASILLADVTNWVSLESFLSRYAR